MIQLPKSSDNPDAIILDRHRSRLEGTVLAVNSLFPERQIYHRTWTESDLASTIEETKNMGLEEKGLLVISDYLIGIMKFYDEIRMMNPSAYCMINTCYETRQLPFDPAGKNIDYVYSPVPHSPYDQQLLVAFRRIWQHFHDLPQDHKYFLKSPVSMDKAIRKSGIVGADQ